MHKIMWITKKKHTKAFDYITITYQPRFASSINNSHKTCVVNLRLNGLTFQLPTIAVQSKGHEFKNYWINLHIETMDLQPSLTVESYKF